MFLRGSPCLTDFDIFRESAHGRLHAETRHKLGDHGAARFLLKALSQGHQLARHSTASSISPPAMSRLISTDPALPTAMNSTGIAATAR